MLRLRTTVNDESTMDQEAQAIRKIMKDKKLRITPQRFAVYANLLSREDHPTVEEIMSEVNQNLPLVSNHFLIFHYFPISRISLASSQLATSNPI